MPKTNVKSHTRVKDGKKQKVRASTRDVPTQHAKLNSAIDKLRNARDTEYDKVRQLRAPYEESPEAFDQRMRHGLPAPPRKEMSKKVKDKIAHCESRAEFHGRVIDKLHEKKNKLMDKAAEKAASTVLKSGAGRNNSVTSAGTGYIDTNTNYIQSNS